jgi:hypothetical protein
MEPLSCCSLARDTLTELRNFVQKREEFSHDVVRSFLQSLEGMLLDQCGEVFAPSRTKLSVSALHALNAATSIAICWKEGGCFSEALDVFEFHFLALLTDLDTIRLHQEQCQSVRSKLSNLLSALKDNSSPGKEHSILGHEHCLCSYEARLLGSDNKVRVVLWAGDEAPHCRGQRHSGNNHPRGVII